MNWQRLQKSKLSKKIKEVFSQGLSTIDIIKAAVLGMLIGIMPIFGVSTLIVTFLAIKLRLNLGVAIFFVYAVSPLHPLLFIPFIHIGESIFDITHTLLSFKAIKASFYADVLDTLKKLSAELMCGLAGWSFAAIPVLSILTFLQFRKQKP